MSNYYEILNVPHTASHSEIEQALDAQYNKIRRLITHHDPNVVNQANSGLQMLEKIRSTLMDAGKRSAYDAAVFPQLGGLIDPAISSPPGNSQPGLFGDTPHPASFSTSSRPAAPIPGQRSWTCPKCQSANAVNSQFCKHCGETLAAPCPSCGKLAEKNAEFCTNCGVNIPKAQQKMELDRQLGEIRNDFNLTSKNKPVLDKNIPELNKGIIQSGLWALVSLITAITFLFASPGEFPGVDLSGPILQLTDGLRYSSGGMIGRYVFTGIGVLLMTGILVLLSILRRTSPAGGIGVIFAGILIMVLPKTIWSLLQALLGASVSPISVMLISIFLYAFVFRRILSITRKSFALLKPSNSRLPKAGFLGILFSWVLSATPLLYGFYIISLIFGMINEFSIVVNRYETQILQINGIQLIFLGVLLAAYTLMSLKTAQAGEVRYRQAVSERTEKMEKLTRQMQSLEHAVAQIDLYSR